MPTVLIGIAEDERSNDTEQDREHEVGEMVLWLPVSTSLADPQSNLTEDRSANTEDEDWAEDAGKMAQACKLKRHTA